MSVVIQDIIIPESSSECPEWTAYFKKLEDRFGEENARLVWLKTWQVNGSTSCTTKPEFLVFLKKHNIDVSNVATKAIADISEIGGNIMGLGKNITKILSIGIPVTLGLVVLIILYFIFKTAKSVDVKDIANLTPEGRIATMIK